jgi:DNA-binding CsgD family transcriptional regulator
MRKSMLSSDHFYIKQTPNVTVICEKLFKDSKLSNFFYGRTYDDGSMVSFHTNSDWGIHFFDQNYDDFLIHTFNIGFNDFDKIKPYGSVCEDARTNFDLVARNQLTRRGSNYIEAFGFGASTENESSAKRFYVQHQDKLLRFVSYFEQQAKSLLVEAENHKIQLPNYKCPIYNMERNFAEEMTATGEELSLKSKELVTMLLYAQGCTVPEIAKILLRAPKTVEHYVSEIKYKTKCTSKMEMNAYVRARGWQDLVGFFFNYIH